MAVVCVQVCSFQDGSVGVYDLRKRSWDFLTEEAHTETIFDCVFKPDNRDHLATRCIANDHSVVCNGQPARY